MKQFIDDNGQEWGFDIGDAHFFADEEMTIELPARTFSKEQIAQIMGGVPIIRCKDCKWYGWADKRRFYRVMDCLQNRIDTIVPDEDYCSWAERKKE